MKDKTPYVVVALQEAVRMNTLLTEMRQSMEELLLGLGGSLNMSDKMEKLATGAPAMHALLFQIISCVMSVLFSMSIMRISDVSLCSLDICDHDSRSTSCESC